MNMQGQVSVPKYNQYQCLRVSAYLKLSTVHSTTIELHIRTVFKCDAWHWERDYFAQDV